MNRIKSLVKSAQDRARANPAVETAGSALITGLNKLGLWLQRITLGDKTLLLNYFPVILVTLVGLLITLLAFQQVTGWEAQRVETSFREAANDRVLVVQREIEHTLGRVQDIASLFDASPNVGRREFRRFVEPAIKRHGGIQLLGWIPRVQGLQRDAFTERARASFPPFSIIQLAVDGQIIEAAQRPDYLPLLYVQPYKENKNLLGMDMVMDSVFFPMLQNAAYSEQLQVTERLSGNVDALDSEFLVAVPLYFKHESQPVDLPASTGPALPEHLRGFAVGVFKTGEVVELALRSLSASGIDLRFYLEDGDREGTLLYRHQSRLAGLGLDRRPDDISSRLQFERQLKVGNRYWRVHCRALEGSFEADFWSGWIVLSGGISFTALLSIYIATLLGRARKVKLLVDQRTQQLRDLVQKLNNQIVERRNAEIELQNLNDDLEYWVAIRSSEAERRAEDLEQFAYVTSHDLKAPLRGIANLAEWIGDDLQEKLEPESREQLRLLRDRVQRMHALIEGLLEYSRVGRTEGSYSKVDSRELLDEIIDSLSPPPSFRIEIQDEMPVFRTDRLQLGQVFSNLISNSLKHYRGSKGKIKVTCKDLEDRYQFEVLDNGPGIAREYHDKIFKMFQVLEASDYGSNTGIGLALVKKIVQEQGGTITLKSKVGKGARFRFTWLKNPA